MKEATRLFNKSDSAGAGEIGPEEFKQLVVRLCNLEKIAAPKAADLDQAFQVCRFSPFVNGSDRLALV